MSRIRGHHAEIIAARYKGLFDEKNYGFFDGGHPFNLNIVGVRNSDGRVNKFDDFLLTIYRDNQKRWIVDSYQITTDPGLYWLLHPMNVNGTAILCPGQYRGAYKVGKHAGKYDALCQQGAPITVWRDADRDRRHDMSQATLDTGYFGVNIHKAGRNSNRVDKWSAGCQVFKNEGDFKEFMNTVRRAEKKFGNSFTYTLVNGKEVVG
jgi:hypothetical protein